MNWGLGHASRGIFLVQTFLDAGHHVILAADREAYFLLQSAFPSLELIRFPFSPVRYSRIFPMWLKMIMSIPGFIYSIYREHHILKQWISGRHVDLIISDNRYGIYYKGICSVFITHQLYIKAPRPFRMIEPVLFHWNRRRLRKFNEVWIPDGEGDNDTLAGVLSHPGGSIPHHIRYIGPLSRFMVDKYTVLKPVTVSYDVVVVLSGPEPHRTVLEQILIRKLRNREYKVLMLRGLPWKKSAGRVSDTIRMVTHLDPALFYTYLSQARYIVARAGYTTIMDLSYLGKPALLVPTPGQPEQEYLAAYHAAGNRFIFMEQHQIDIEDAFARLDILNKEKRETTKPEKLKQAVADIVQAIYQRSNAAIKNPVKKPR